MSGIVTEKPYTSRVFGLPHTHTISDTRPGSIERIPFLVWVLGFLLGMRFTTTGAGFLDATPIQPNTLHDGPPSTRDLPRLMECADGFWTANASNARIAKALAGAINSLLLSHNPQALEYEMFIYTYLAFEGCHYVWSTQNGMKTTGIGHGARITNLCAQCGTVVPDWTDPKTGITGPRNETLHEGLFFDEPLGFALFGGNARVAAPNTQPYRNVLLEMQNLASRFIVALLRIPAPDYVKSPVDTRQVIGLDLGP